MKEDYFDHVVSSLTFEDMQLLGTLYAQEATASFKSLKTSTVQELTGLTEATYRRTVSRLLANRFIEIIPVKKQNSVYITQYGIAALMKNVEGVSA